MNVMRTRWTMQKNYPHLCVCCGKDYNAHYPWPELPCHLTLREWWDRKWFGWKVRMQRRFPHLLGS